MLSKAQKKEWAKDFSEKLGRSQVAVFMDFRGLEAPEADELRKVVREAKGEVKVLKNNIARKAVADGTHGEDAKQLLDTITGPTMVAFAYEDAAVVAKSIKAFIKEHEALDLKAALMGKKTITQNEVQDLADLPSLDVMRQMLLGTFQAPARNFVQVCAGIPRGFINVLNAKKAKDEGA